MNAKLLKEVFADANASAQASQETRALNEATVQRAAQYIHLANSSIETSLENGGSAREVRTETVQEYRARMAAQKKRA